MLEIPVDEEKLFVIHQEGILRFPMLIQDKVSFLHLPWKYSNLTLDVYFGKKFIRLAILIEKRQGAVLHESGFHLSINEKTRVSQRDHYRLLFFYPPGPFIASEVVRYKRVNR